ncbi:glycosyltransferase family 2 protein [Aeromicrobium stalagmiti]|uniref:glycosyltransferase family 2 protein n=1 Tax=Aeromicrobium stalagmiti TaxID=2738988 RepID=UPI001568029F|nr:glycosyltransferase [Aeromicrobium stalagmiti]NRQ49132.1 glycosyltransferase [Aeromicrobium stalagmiti]
MNVDTQTPSARVSVLMPVKNGAATVEAAARSVLADLGPNDELVVVDDGSDDATSDVLKSIPGPIRLLKNTGRGIVDALNTGLVTCRSTYIARCDADDLWLPGHIDSLLQHLESEPEAVAVFGAAILRRPSGEIKTIQAPPRSGDPLRQSMLRGNPLIHGAVLAKRCSIEDVGGYRRLPGAEDFDLWMRLSRIGRLATIDTAVYDYRLSAGTTHAGKRRLQARSTVRILVEHARLTRQVSARGLIRNCASSIWVGKRFWYRA